MMFLFFFENRFFLQKTWFQVFVRKVWDSILFIYFSDNFNWWHKVLKNGVSIDFFGFFQNSNQTIENSTEVSNLKSFHK